MSAAEIAALEDRRYAAMLGADEETLKQLFDDRAIYTHSSGVPDTKAYYIESLTTGRLKYHSIERSNQEVVMFDHTALVKVNTRLHVTNPSGEKTIHGQGTAVWTRVGGGWKFIAWHSTPVAAPST
jgi:hypothetical protein